MLCVVLCEGFSIWAITHNTRTQAQLLQYTAMQCNAMQYDTHFEAHDLLVAETRGVAQQIRAAEHDLGVVACEHACCRPRCFVEISNAIHRTTTSTTTATTMARFDSCQQKKRQNKTVVIPLAWTKQEKHTRNENFCAPYIYIYAGVTKNKNTRPVQGGR